MRPMHVSSGAVVQSCLLEAKSYNRVLKYQRFTTLYSPILGKLHQSTKKSSLVASHPCSAQRENIFVTLSGSGNASREKVRKQCENSPSLSPLFFSP